MFATLVTQQRQSKIPNKTDGKCVFQQLHTLAQDEKHWNDSKEGLWCYIRHIKIKGMFINTVSSCVFQYVHRTSEVLYSEVSFPEELFEDGFIARSRQAGKAPQSRFLVGVVLPPS